MILSLCVVAVVDDVAIWQSYFFLGHKHKALTIKSIPKMQHLTRLATCIQKVNWLHQSHSWGIKLCFERSNSRMHRRLISTRLLLIFTSKFNLVALPDCYLLLFKRWDATFLTLTPSPPFYHFPISIKPRLSHNQRSLLPKQCTTTLSPICIITNKW